MLCVEATMKFEQPLQKPSKRRINMLRLPPGLTKTLLTIVLVSLGSSLLLLRAAATVAPDGPAPSVEAYSPIAQATSSDSSTNSATDSTYESSKSLPANHRMEPAELAAETANIDKTKPKAARHGRQYDGPLSSSGSANYGAVSGEGGAYVGSNLPLTGYSAAGSSGGLVNPGFGGADSMGASSGMSGYPASAYHDQMSMARGYPASMHSAGLYPPMAPFGGGGALASMFPSSSGLFSAGSPAFPLMSKGFDIAEIVCTAIAVAIGAVIVGAPFILLYLFVMNQMQGGGPNAMGPGGGSISLTGPTASTNVGGRKKRHTSFPEALFKQLGPLVNSEQVAQTFKALMSSIAKYQV